MATRVQKVKVSVFLLSCAAIFGISAAVITGLYETEGEYFSIEFEESVLGLYEGGMVEYLGVPVGKVREIYVTRENKAHVEVVINPEKVTLREGVEAQLVLYSIAAGTMAISLTGGEVGAHLLPHNSQIPEKRSTIGALSSQIVDLMDNMASIVETIQVGLEGVEEGDLAALVDKVDALLADGQDFVADGRTVLGNADTTLTELRGEAKQVVDRVLVLSNDVQELTHNINTLVLKTTDKMDDLDVAKTQGQLGVVLENVSVLTERLNKTVAELDTMKENVLHQADNVEFSLRQTVQEMSESLEVVRGFLTQLKDDPSSLVRGKARIKE